MKNSTRYALFAIFILALFLRLFPLMNTLHWGADYGEYYFISNELLVNNHISTQYFGWGAVYPDFPGMEVLSSSVSELSDVSLPAALSLVVPILASLTVIFVFLIGVEIFRDERIGLAAAAVVAVVLPHVYPTSHSMPGSLGDLLFVLCLLLFVKMQSNARLLAALLPLSIALVLTHHLSTYFLLICVLVAIFLKIIYTKTPDIRRLRATIIFLIIFVGSILLYWSLSENFYEYILSGIPGIPWWVLLMGVPLATILLFGFAAVRNKWKYRPRNRYPSFRISLAIFLSALTAALVILSIMVFIGVPGTTMKLHFTSLLFFLPFAVIIAFSGFGKGLPEFYKGGLNISGWIIAIVASLLFGLLFAPRVLIPYRHIEYLMIPLSLYTGLGLAFFYDIWNSRRANDVLSPNVERAKEKKSSGKRAAILLVVTLLIIGNSISAYPPRDIILGYDEGTDAKSMDGVYWVGLMTDEDSVVASDHRMSSMIFGFAERNSTWDRAPLTLNADSFDEARDEMSQASLPSGTKRIDYVLIDENLKQGVIIYIWDEARPLSAEALQKFETSNYTKLFDNGFSQLFMVNW